MKIVKVATHTSNRFRWNPRNLSDRLLLATRTGNIGIWELDLANDRLEWDDTMHGIYGTAKEEFTGRYEDWLSRVHPEDRSRANSEVEKALRGEMEFNSEFRVVRPDGSIRHVKGIGLVESDGQGCPQRMLGTNCDVTEHKRAEESWRVSSQLNQQIIASAQEGIIVYDRDLKYQVWNPFMERLTGVQAGEVIGKHPADLFPFLADTGTIGAIQRALGGVTTEAFEYPFKIAATGKAGWVCQTITPLRDASAEIAGAISMVRDISAHKSREEHLRLLEKAFQSAANAMVITDHEGRLLFANPAFTKLTGYTAEEVLGRKLNFLKSGKHTDDYYRNLWETILHGSVWRTEIVNRRKDGSTYTEDNTITPVLNDVGQITHFISVKQDISDRVRAEEELRESEERFRQVTENIESVFWLNTARSEQVLYVSPAYERIWGRPRGGLYARPSDFLEAVHPKDRQRVLRQYQEKQKGVDRKFEIEFRIVRPDGSVRWIRSRAFPANDTAGELQFVVGIADDITERKDLENEVALREQQLQSFFGGATAGLAMLDKDLRFLHMNDVLAGMNGFPVDEHLGKTLREIVPRLASTLEPILKGVLVTSQPVHNLEVSGETPSRPGVERYWIESFFPILGKSGKPEAVGAIVVETTELKRLEGQLRQAQKMEAIGQLAGGIAHDFNNILAAMLMHVGLFQQNPQITMGMKDTLKDLETDTMRAASLTRQLLLFSRRQVARVEPLDMSVLIYDLLKMLRRLLGENIETDFQTSGDVWVQADAGMLEQVVMNLCINARDAMPNGGRLTVRTTSVDRNSESPKRHADARPGRFVRLGVTDNGCGMEESVFKRLFEPFFTTKEVGKGTGLGLATVYGIVQQHQGWIEVESVPGKGSSFYIYFPALAAATEKTDIREHSEEVRGGAETILLVEDDLSLRRSTALCLRKLGYAVLEAGNGVDALKIWEQRRQGVELVLTDMVMPGAISGLDLVQRMRKVKPSLKALLTSGYSTELARVSQSGPEIAYLAKPWSAAALAKIVRQCLDDS